MNAPITRAAEGLPRRAFTVREIERMTEIGLMREDERIELIGGEIVAMSPKGNRHEVLKTALLRKWYREAPAHIELTPETTLRLSENTFLEPDIIVFDRESGLSGLTGETVLLAVEIADTSLGYDLGRKPAIYAAFGVREVWVIDAAHLVVHVHRNPHPLGYGDVVALSAADQARPLLAPELAVTLADLILGR